MSFARLSSLLVSAALALSACGGGGSSPAPPTAGGSSQAGPTSFKVFIPAGSAATSSRRPNALPSTTESIEIAVASTTNPTPVAPAIFNVGASAPGCQSVDGGISCTETVTVPFGNVEFAVIAFAGPNATGAAIAEGVATATIGSGTNSVSVTMNAESIYAGSSVGGGIGVITIDHSTNTFAVTGGNTNASGTVTALPNGDLKLVVTSATDQNTVQGDIVYAREIQGSVLIFADTGSATVIPSGAVQDVQQGGDVGGGVALQGCPTSGLSTPVTVAEVAGPAWNDTPSTSPAYTSGTATISVSGGTATLSFSGNYYSSSGVEGAAQSGTQTCANGIFSQNDQGDVAISPDNIVVVSNGNGNNVQATDVQEGGFGFAESGAINTTNVLAGTYDGFVGGLSLSGSNVVNSEQPFQATPGSGSSLNACAYTNFEAGTVGTTCATITFGSQTGQPGVVLATVTMPSQPSSQGALVIGQTSSGKYVIFGNIGGTNIFFVQH